MNRKSFQHPLTNFTNKKALFSNLLDTLDPERIAQREEFLKREKKKDPRVSCEKPKKFTDQVSKPKKNKIKKRKAMNFEGKLKKAK